jgi:para-nitrobenzyl esterase
VFQTYEEMVPVLGPPETARPAGDALHQAVVSFVKTGAPRAPGAPEWPAYDVATRPCMMIDRTCALAHDIDAGFEDIW